MKSTRPFVRSYFQKLPLRLAVALIVFIGTLLLFVFLVHEVLWQKEEAVDHQVFSFFDTHILSDDVTPLMKGVTYLASSTFLQISYALLVVFYLSRKELKRAVEISVLGLGGFLINYVMKLSFQRPRPADPLIEPLKNFSFPSGHATSAFIFYGLLAYLLWKTKMNQAAKLLLACVLLLLSILIGFSRVYLRLHYFSDVIAGFCIGFAWLMLAIYVFETLKKKTSREIRGGKAA
jgi:membrane-associated phospholipid phosphatase